MITDFSIFEGKNDLKYQYIQYKIGKDITIVRVDLETFDCRMLDLNNNTFSEFGQKNLDIINGFERSDIVKEPGNYWRNATESEIKHFKMMDVLNKYNI